MEWMLRYLPWEKSNLDLLTSLFLSEIMARPRSKGFKCQTITLYKGIRDMKNHVLNFQSLMPLHTEENHILYKTFAITLRRSTFT